MADDNERKDDDSNDAYRRLIVNKFGRTSLEPKLCHNCQNVSIYLPTSWSEAARRGQRHKGHFQRPQQSVFVYVGSFTTS